MNKIRILHMVSGVDIGNRSGGAESHALHITHMIDRNKFEPYVFIVQKYDSLEEKKWLNKLQDANVNIINCYEGKANDNSFLQELKCLWRSIKSIQPDIIHSHSERNDLLNLLTCLFHPLHPLAIRTVHIDQQWQTHKKLGSIIEKTIFPRFFSKEVVVSQTLQNLLAGTGLRNKSDISICYNGIDQSFFYKKPPENYPQGIPEIKPLIGIVARLTEQKNHSILIKTIDEVNQILETKVNLLIIGDGPLKNSLKNLTKELELENVVHFLGVRNDILDILPFLDLFILPSQWEGFPTALLEAMSQEVLVIATNVSGSCELVEDGITGFLVKSNDQDSLVEKTIYALTHPEESQEIAKRGKVFAKQYTLQNMVVCYEKIYDGIFYSYSGNSLTDPPPKK